MSFKIQDGEGNLKDFQSTGTGTGGDPFIPQHLETNSASIAAKSDTIIGHIDGIEAQLTTLAGYLDGLEGLLAGTLTISGTVTANLNTLNGAATSAKQDTIIGHVDGIEGQLATLAGYLDGLEGYVDGLEGQLTTLAGYVDGLEGQLTTITGHVDGVETLLGAGSVVKSGSITRPADTNAYVAGDALTNSTSSPTTPSISGCARGNGLSGTIIGAVLVDSANQSTKADIDVLIFDTTFTTDNDNAAFTPSDAEMETCIGVISFSGGTAKSGDATSGAGGNCIMQGTLNSPIPFVCGAGSTSLFYQLVFRSGYTPVSGEKFTLRLLIQQD